MTELYYDAEKEIIYAKCTDCGKYVGMRCTEEQKERFLDRTDAIQNIFPDAPPGTREVFISGLCNECFESIFEGME